jgi:sulfur-carrier protein
MPVVWIPALLRELTGGEEKVEAPGETVRQVIEYLDERYPGIKERLCEEDRLRANMTVIVDGSASRQGMRQKLDETSEVHFLPAMSGG